MSPVVFRQGPYRFYFFSREESRLHIPVASSDGEAKFRLDPVVALADHVGYNKRTLKRLQKLIEEHEHEIRQAWHRHFG